MAEHDDGALTGQVVRRHVREWRGPDGTRWRTTTTVIDLGRPDPLDRADPDAALAPTPAAARPKPPNVVAMNQARAKRQAALVLRVRDHLRRYGPMTAGEMMQDLAVPRSSLLAHLRDHEGTVYRRMGEVRRAVIWGLVEG